MGQRTSQLDTITTIDNADLLYGVDVSDLAQSPDGKFTISTHTDGKIYLENRTGGVRSYSMVLLGS